MIIYVRKFWIMEGDRLLYSLCLGHRGLLVVYVFIVFAPSSSNSPEWFPPVQGTSGAPAPGSSQDPVSLRSRSRNDSNTVPVLVSMIHLLIIRVHYRFLIQGAWVACISGCSRPPGGVGLTPRQYTVWNVEGGALTLLEGYLSVGAAACDALYCQCWEVYYLKLVLTHKEPNRLPTPVPMPRWYI